MWLRCINNITLTTARDWVHVWDLMIFWKPLIGWLRCYPVLVALERRYLLVMELLLEEISQNWEKEEREWILSRTCQRGLFYDFSYLRSLSNEIILCMASILSWSLVVTKFFESPFQSPFPSNFKPSKNTTCSASVHGLPFFLPCLVWIRRLRDSLHQHDHWTPHQETVNCPRYNCSSHFNFLRWSWIWSEIFAPKSLKLWPLCPQ